MDAISPYIGNSKKTNHHFISRFPFRSSNIQGKGRSQASPPFLSHSYPPFSLQQEPQPPLLPLPAANHQRRAATRGISSPPNNRKIHNSDRTFDSSLTPKKAKSSNYRRKENDISSTKKCSDSASVSPNPSLGPAPIHLPQNGAKVSPFIILSNKNNSIRSQKQTVDQCDKFSGSVTFAISPPPSSLPLPTFSLRPKLSCMVEAAGIHSGATDNLRRLLRIL